MAKPDVKTETAQATLPAPADDMAAQLAALQAKLAAAEAKLAERAVIAAAPLNGLYAKCRIIHGATVIEAGAPLPFDPSDEKAAKAGGFDGLEEGVHWERGR